MKALLVSLPKKIRGHRMAWQVVVEPGFGGEVRAIPHFWLADGRWVRATHSVEIAGHPKANELVLGFLKMEPYLPIELLRLVTTQYVDDTVILPKSMMGTPEEVRRFHDDLKHAL